MGLIDLYVLMVAADMMRTFISDLPPKPLISGAGRAGGFAYTDSWEWDMCVSVQMLAQSRAVHCSSNSTLTWLIILFNFTVSSNNISI